MFACTKLINHYRMEQNILSLNGCSAKTEFDMMKMHVRFLQILFSFERVHEVVLQSRDKKNVQQSKFVTSFFITVRTTDNGYEA